MCGLSGILIGTPPGKEGLNRIKLTFRANLLANEVRGKEATGVAALQSNGSCRVEKLPLTASEFVETSLFKNFMEESVTTGTTILLGHTRKPTKGSVFDNNNNHPIVVGDTVGVHNGTVANDDEIFMYRRKAFKALSERIGSVDSEAIFTLMNDLDLARPDRELVEDIAQATKLIAGSYSSLFFSSKRPRTLFVFRCDNPISLHYERELDCLHLSSRYLFLRKQFGTAVISKPLANRFGYFFEAALLSALEKTPPISFPIGGDPEKQPTEQQFWRLYGDRRHDKTV